MKCRSETEKPNESMKDGSQVVTGISGEQNEGREEGLARNFENTNTTAGTAAIGRL